MASSVFGQAGGEAQPTVSQSVSGPEADRIRRAGPRKPHRSLTVRFLIVGIVLVPMLATGFLIASSAASAWKTRQDAGEAASDATQLAVVASARAQMSNLETPMAALSYAAQVGLSEPVLDQLLHPATPFQEQVVQETAMIAGYPTFSSTPTMRADVAQIRLMIPEVAARTISFAKVNAFFVKMGADIDHIWYRDYNRLQTEIESWRPPASFEVHVAALRQTYQAFLAGDGEIGGAIYVLEGTGPADAKQDLIQAAGQYQNATSEFAGQLSPKAAQAWRYLQTNPADVRFAATIREGVSVALDGTKPPFVDNLAFASTSMTPGLTYLTDLNRLVTAASQDLHDTAASQAIAATGQFANEIILLTLLALVCLGGVLVVGRLLTRPLKKLAAGAIQVHNGDFDLERLPETGPREVVTTTAAFNDMVSTLKAVEAKAVALAEEDLSDPELLTPLPGRTGQALQASVDTLTVRIREREIQRQLLHEAATHDGLTGLLTRAAVLEHLTHDVTRRRDAGETVAVLFVDLDGLKPLNDTYGHEVGDEAILTTGMALVQATEGCDVVGRLGGDEFLVVLCHDHSLNGDDVVDRIRDCVGQCRIPVDDKLIPLAASVGVALAQCDPDTDPMLLVRQADEAMYEAKKTARAIRDRTIASDM